MMKAPHCIALFFALTTTICAASFTPLGPDERYGSGTNAWRFASNLSKEATGAIAFCYAEEGGPERILGTVALRPFVSSRSEMPELRILFSRAPIDGQEKVLLIVGYGIRSGTFVVNVPGLVSNSLHSHGSPQESADGEITLLGFGNGVKSTPTGLDISTLRGRLYFRYAGTN